MRDFQITRHILGIYANITKTNITSCPPISKLQQYLFRFWNPLLFQKVCHGWAAASIACITKVLLVAAIFITWLMDGFADLFSPERATPSSSKCISQIVRFNWMFPARNDAPLPKPFGIEGLLSIHFDPDALKTLLWWTRGNFFVAAHEICFSTSVTASRHHNRDWPAWEPDGRRRFKCWPCKVQRKLQ